MKKLVFLLVGSRKRVGKDTVAKLLHYKLAASGRPVAKTAFAQALKVEVQELLHGWPETHNIDAFTEDPVLKENVTRPLLIAWGMLRRHLNPNYWIDKVEEYARLVNESTLSFEASVPAISDPYRFIIVSDWRFPNELVRLKELGYVVRGIDVRRDDQPNEIPEEIKNAPLCAALATTTIPNLHGLDTLSRVCDGVVFELNRIYPNHE